MASEGERFLQAFVLLVVKGSGVITAFLECRSEIDERRGPLAARIRWYCGFRSSQILTIATLFCAFPPVVSENHNLSKCGLDFPLTG
jgi:hypothetical protein